MVVCLCNGVSDRQVRRAIDCGAATRPQVTASCGAGGACGGCHRMIRDMIREGETPRFADSVCLQATA